MLNTPAALFVMADVATSFSAPNLDRIMLSFTLTRPRQIGFAALTSLSVLGFLWTARRPRALILPSTFRMSSSNSSLPPPPNALAAFLHETKSGYLGAISGGTANDWTVVLGNEAGDLDSLASAIALAWFLAPTQRAVPLYQAARADLHLRPENLYALELAGLGDAQEALLCASDVPAPLPSTRFALVDHNALTAPFASANATIVAIVDHHVDEEKHPDASPRLITVPTGSCASLVASLFPDPATLPPSLSSLILSAIVIDTQGLKTGGKAEAADHAAAAALAPLSGLEPAGFGGDNGLAALNAALQTKKNDVSTLSTRDLLRRDYKEYLYAGGERIGLASVPVSLHVCAANNSAFAQATSGWAVERKLDALGVLTSFRDPDHLNKKGNAKHRREQLWLAQPELAGRLFEGLEANVELDLRETTLDGTGAFGEGWKTRAYKQKNADATRKVTAPVVKAIIETTRPGEGKL
jgi:exopolyphosphatase